MCEVCICHSNMNCPPFDTPPSAWKLDESILYHCPIPRREWCGFPGGFQVKTFRDPVICAAPSASAITPSTLPGPSAPVSVIGGVALRLPSSAQ